MLIYSSSASYPLGKFALTGCGGIIDLTGLGAITSVHNTIIVSGHDNTENGATMFTGVAESQVKIENIAKLDTKYSLSIFLNVYVEESGSVVNYGTDRGVGLYYDKTNGELVFRVVKRNTTDLIAEIKTKVDAKKWYHVGGTYDYNTGKTYLYIDNKQEAVSDTPKQDMLATGSTIYLGAIAGATDKFKGRVSCLQMFDRAVEEADINNLKKCLLSESFDFLHPPTILLSVIAATIVLLYSRMYFETDIFIHFHIRFLWYVL